MVQFKYPIILASGSPRRKELLEMLEIPFIVKIAPIEEHIPSNIAPKDAALYLANQKADAHMHLAKNHILITADTTVIANDKELGKPTTPEHAIEMLSALSGQTHEVITGVVIRANEREHAFSVTTSVTFRRLTSQEISHYVASGKANDKAGSYGIQDWIGLIGIERIEGSYYNVMGFPTLEVYQSLKVNFSY